MSVTIYSPPFAEPVHLTELKVHCKVDTDLTEDDSLISGQALAARDVAETGTGSNSSRSKVMLATTFDFTLESFPLAWRIQIPRVPVISITSITYIDSNGDTQTLSTDAYTLADANLGRIELKYQQIWPVTRWQPNAVTIRFIAGMAATFTAAVTDVCTVSGRTFSNDDRVFVLNSGGALPAGLVTATPYFVVNASGYTFKLSATSGGTAVDITDTGSGTQFAVGDLAGFQSLRAAMKLLVGHWYRSREAVQLAPGLTSVILPMGVDALIAAAHA